MNRHVQRFIERMEPRVFIPAAIIVVFFVIAGSGFTEAARSAFDSLQSAIVAKLGWFYVLVASGLLVLVVWLALSRHGGIKLGSADQAPEFGYLGWFSMLLSAGMGIGIVFFGAAEPLLHYLSPPGEGIAPQSATALREAMQYTFYHWGLHPWAIYSLFALSLAYFHFRHDLPLAPRSLLYPLIGDGIYGVLGHAVDVLCTVGTLFGVATSLGLGAIQINSGLSRLFGLPRATDVQLLLVAAITAIATISVVSGLHRGIRLLSKTTVALASLILAFVLVTGPTVYILELFVEGLGTYVQQLPMTGTRLFPGRDDDWQATWTLFYWSWWISWSPFVGVFVARISKGRTIREFVVAVLAVPSLVGFLWFSALGGTGIRINEATGGSIAQTARQNNALALFSVLEHLPWSSITLVLATLLVVIFFVTSSDSGSLVDDMVTSGGHPNPPRAQRIFWALSEGAVAAVLLHSGGLKALRSASLTTGVPVALLLLGAAHGLLRALRSDSATSGVPSSESLIAKDAAD